MSNTRRSFPLFAIAAVILAILKLGNVASFGDVSWWIIALVFTGPLWLWLIIVFGAVIIALLASIIAALRTR